MAEAAREAGAEIRTAAAVSEVLVESGRAVGVALEGGEEIRADPGPLERRSEDGPSSASSTRPSSRTAFVAALRAYRCEGTSVKINLGARSAAERRDRRRLRDREPYLAGSWRST